MQTDRIKIKRSCVESMFLRQQKELKLKFGSDATLYWEDENTPKRPHSDEYVQTGRTRILGEMITVSGMKHYFTDEAAVFVYSQLSNESLEWLEIKNES